MHGGLSTGPKTAAGKARTLAALKAGFQCWVAERRAEREGATTAEAVIFTSKTN